MQPNTASLCRTDRQGKFPGEEDGMFSEHGVNAIVTLFPLAIIVVVFTFVIVVRWFDTQRKEREAYYKAETLRRVAEASGEGAKAAVELMREDERLRRIKTREGLKIAGLVNVGVGIGLLIFLRALLGNTGIYLCGLIPALVGVGLLVYMYFLASPVE
jgi:hypothetical protein